MKRINKKNGFTLFELLVSISIISVMTAIAVISFGGISKKSRDARRMADLEKIRISLEAARQVGNTYPTTSTVQTILVPTYLQQWPKDPKTGLIYTYTGLTTNTYQVCAVVEDLGSTNNPVANCNYKVVNP
jgi:prepilin-type N-terminal cleavage/methylation domain-containing protein